MDDASTPIFLLGMQRGGTNLVLNLLRSHPACCWPEGEFHEVIRGRRADSVISLLGKTAGYLPIRAVYGDVIHPMRIPEPGVLQGFRGRLVRRALDRSVRANREAVRGFRMRLSNDGCAERERDERMVCKVVNGNTALAWDLAGLYPNARFLAVVRHPYAVCEGLMRRGASLERAIGIYRVFADTLMRLECAERPVFPVRYEDIVADPVGVAGQMYALCDLDERRVEWVCLQEKTAGPDEVVRKVNRFYRLPDIGQHMRTGLNEDQAARLSDRERGEIARACREAIRRFGYAETGVVPGDEHGFVR